MFINLCNNAFDAMKETGGQVIIRSDNITKNNKSYVKTEVEDTGCGISKEELPKVFDPFYSTQATSTAERLGFGLSIVHEIIKKHEGTIKVESKLGKGTKFTIILPAL